MAYTKKKKEVTSANAQSVKNPTGYREEKKQKTWVQIAFADPKSPWLEQARALRAGYNGKYHRNYARKNRFCINTFFSIVQLMLPHLLFGQTYIRVKPKSAKYYKTMPDGTELPRDVVAASKIREAAINHDVAKTALFTEKKLALMDSFFYGFGITKAGYSAETVRDLDNDYILKESRWVKRVDPRDFGWHPLATRMDNSPFFAERIFMPKERALLIPGIDKKKINDAKVETPQHIKDRLEAHSRNHSESFTDNCTEGYISLCEIHDEEKDTISIWSPDGETQYRSPEKDRFKFKEPHFSRIQLAGDNELFEGIPLLAMIQDQALVLNELFTLMLEHVRKFPAQLFLNKGTLTENDLEQIRSGAQGAIHTVDDVNGMKHVSPVPMGNDYYTLVRMIQDIVDLILGIPDFQRGNSSTRRSATEASLIHGASTVRRDYYLSLVKDFVLEDVNKIAALQEQYQDQEEEIRVSGDPIGDPIMYDRTDIQGKWLYDFELADLQASNEVQLNTLINLIGTLGKVPEGEPVLASMNPMKLGNALFKLGGMNIESYQWDPNDPNMDRVFSMVADRLLQMGQRMATGATGRQVPGAGASVPGGGVMNQSMAPAGPMEPTIG